MPSDYLSFKTDWQRHAATRLDDYALGKTTFVEGVLPEDLLRFPARGVLYLLERKYGPEAVRRALLPGETVASPVAHHADGTWLRRTNMVGINVRTIGSFWSVIPYSLTLPAAQDSIHLLPIWEPGVVASLYGMASWHLNREFYSPDLAEALPHLDSVEKQLKVVVNLLHLMGRSVGMDVIPHTDRYAEIVLINPGHFEWLQRRDLSIVNHSDRLYETVQQRTLDWLRAEGPAVPWLGLTLDPADFFGEKTPEAVRTRLLFGEPANLWGRNARRNRLIQALYDEGLEPVPATMAPPYRGLAVDPDESAKTVDDDGRVWRDYVVTKPESMSRVFGPLTRYRLFESKDDNRNWELDFSTPRVPVWQYAAEHYAAVARTYGFDFMRGDMSHVQMNPTGVPAAGVPAAGVPAAGVPADGAPTETNDFYDIHRYIKAYVRREKPWFGYFAESFLAPPNVMAYGDEPDHLEASHADTTLGDLQSQIVGTAEFMAEFARYRQLLETRRFAPSFTVMTADKDDPRFDEFYLTGNEVRLFLALFLTDMPSYVALGFETRDPHPAPAPNEHYTKLYVFQLHKGPNATHGPYQWGHNGELFHRLTRLRRFADEILPKIEGEKMQWLMPPSANAGHQVIAWRVGENPAYVFIANLDRETPHVVPDSGGLGRLEAVFSTHIETVETVELAAGEGRVYKIV